MGINIPFLTTLFCKEFAKDLSTKLSILICRPVKKPVNPQTTLQLATPATKVILLIDHKLIHNEFLKFLLGMCHHLQETTPEPIPVISLNLLMVWSLHCLLLMDLWQNQFLKPLYVYYFCTSSLGLNVCYTMSIFTKIQSC